ncbi:hypothetical protein OsJ_17873 [Oryza sativa Japonica Group]|uniref:Uncharacterized protein n=1 Tax=Oryza sativa subsp. japonica TaxID=39947 RepID=B9FJU7_ORYSJ|nr:hypothetical protein OsJ_17873 [Oryza sativa Japonica Group]
MDPAAGGPRDRRRRHGGGDGTGDVEGGGRRWCCGVMDPAAGSPARWIRRGGVEAEGRDGAGDVEAAVVRRDGGSGGSAARWKGGRRERDGMGMQPGWMRVAL